MLSILAITFPIFAVIALGFALVRFKVFKPEDMRAFGGFVMNVAMPSLIFQAVSSRDIGEVFNLPYMTAYALGGLAVMAVGFGWFSLSQDAARRAVSVIGVTSPNSGFVGYPLMLILFTDQAGLILAMNLLVENILFIPIGLILIDFAKGGDVHLLRKMSKVFIGLLKRPLIIGLLAGLAVSASGLTVPGPIDRVVSVLAAAAAALALVVIGGSLAGIPFRGNLAVASQISFGKLIVQPVLTLVAITALSALGLTLTGDLRTALILSSAMPIFGIYAVIAQEAGEASLASLALLGSTVAAFVTLNILLYVMV